MVDNIEERLCNMPHPSDITQSVIERLMNLKEFTVNVPVEEGWLPTGVVPFNIKIKDCVATITLPAINEEEAIERVVEYIKSNNTEY